MNRTILLFPLLALPLAAQQYKIAIAGLGHAHVNSHLARILKSDEVKLVGIWETEPSVIEQAQKRGATDVPYFKDMNAMLEQTKPDIVWAFTPTYQHLDVVQACAPRKIHVIVEKPLAATYRQALAIQQLAKKYNIMVMTNYNEAWLGSIYKLKQLADSGELGQVYRLRGVMGHGGPGDYKTSYFVSWLVDPEKNGGGALVDFGCYSVVWSLWQKGRPESVYATVLHLRPDEFPKVEDNATIILNYKDGVGIFEGSWDLPPRQQGNFEIFGRKASAAVRGSNVEVYKGRGAPAMLAADPLPPERAQPISYIVNRLRTGQPLDHWMALDVNVAVMEILEAAKMSVRTGRPTPLPLKQ